MSACTFIAADIPLEERKNPHDMLLSVNEALSMGIQVDQEFLSPGVDRDAPNMILWSDVEIVIDHDKIKDGDAPDNFSLCEMENCRYYCEKPYGVYIDWYYYTKERAVKIIEYIKKVLRQTDCVEIWNVWISDLDMPKVKTTTIHINDLKPTDIQQITEADPWVNQLVNGIEQGDTPVSRCLKVLTK